MLYMVVLKLLVSLIFCGVFFRNLVRFQSQCMLGRKLPTFNIGYTTLSSCPSMPPVLQRQGIMCTQQHGYAIVKMYCCGLFVSVTLIFLGFPSSIDGPSLLLLTDGELRDELGVASALHRRKLLAGALRLSDVALRVRVCGCKSHLIQLEYCLIFFAFC